MARDYVFSINVQDILRLFSLFSFPVLACDRVARDCKKTRGIDYSRHVNVTFTVESERERDTRGIICRYRCQLRLLSLARINRRETARSWRPGFIARIYRY